MSLRSFLTLVLFTVPLALVPQQAVAVPQWEVTPTFLEFGQVVNNTNSRMTITVKNVGDQIAGNVTVAQGTGRPQLSVSTGYDDFAQTSFGTCGKHHLDAVQLGPGQSCTATVTFTSYNVLGHFNSDVPIGVGYTRCFAANSCGGDPLSTVVSTTTMHAEVIALPTPAPPSLPPPPPLICEGLAATITGTEGTNAISGTPGNDVIVALGGDDLVDGGGGNDVICGGEGADTLRGGVGSDRLLGENGSDALKGGAGKDICIGGLSIDRAKKCEKVKSL